MSITIEATYESGILKLSQPLPLKEQQRVRITIHAAGNPVQESAGLIPCSDPELIERVALDPIEDL
jgi:predicted DNA-binding antitoxin AbrB/MazE fold protein